MLSQQEEIYLLNAGKTSSTDFKTLLQLRNWTRDEIHQPKQKFMLDSGASINCQNNSTGILPETICETPIKIQCGTGSTTSGKSGIKLIFMEDARDSSTAFLVLLNINVVPGLALQDRTIISPHLLARETIRIVSDDLSAPPYMTSVPPNTSLPVDYRLNSKYSTVLLQRKPSNSFIFIDSVDPCKYKNLRDFVSGGRINIPHMLRRMKSAARCHTQTFQSLAQAFNKLARVRKGFTLTICEDKVITEQPAKSIKVSAIACGLHIESIPNGVLSSDLFHDFHWTIICESNKLLNSFIANRLTQQCPSVANFSLISDLLASKDKSPAVDVTFFTLPCTGMTVLREENQNVPSTEGSMFFDGT